jgi:hypothetical protein
VSGDGKIPDAADLAMKGSELEAKISDLEMDKGHMLEQKEVGFPLFGTEYWYMFLFMHKCFYSTAPSYLCFFLQNPPSADQ